MQPSRASLAASVAAALLFGACAFDDGRPWGVVEVELAASFEVTPDRLVDGQLKTARNYLVRFDAVEVEVEAVTVTQQLGGGAQAFDPANPPPGYSLCHNGHCHRDDGALVDYEDIILELAGGAAAAGPSVTIAAGGAAGDAAVSVPLGERAAVALGPCPGGCVFDRGALGTLRVAVRAVRVSGVVFDELTGESARLGAEGRAFAVSLAPPTSDVGAALSGAFGKDEPFGARLSATLALPATWFDGVDWAAVSDAELAGAVDAAWGERAALTVAISHFD